MPSSLFCSLLACALLVPPGLWAQSIADARNAPLGSTVTVSGQVTSGASLGGIRYLQDADAGIAAFPGSGSVPGFAPQPGDQITVSGTLVEFNGLLEITPISSFTINSTGDPLPPPLVIAPEQMGEDVESRLVRFEGVHFTGSGTFSAGLWTVQAGAQTTQVYFRAGHPLLGTPVPTGPVDITGIASQYDFAPFTGGYQLLPRNAADIIPATQISILPPVEQHTLVQDGFHLSWQTNIPGSTEAFFGPTPALGMHLANGSTGTAHALQFSGLGPATFHYVQPFSVADGDTAFALTGLYATASTSSGSIVAYFTRSVDTSVSTGTDAIALGSATDDTLAAWIDRARHTLDVAMYNTNSQVVVQAVNAAADRGVQVRWIAEGNTANTALNSLHNTIPVLYRTDSDGSGMHNKFFVIDAAVADSALVMTGSCNWTTGSFFLDDNNLVLIQDQALARGYRLEFEQMWGGSGPQPVPALSRFGAEKSVVTPRLYNVGGTLVESFFSPADAVTERLVRAIDEAAHSVHLALFVFTHNDLGDAVLAAHHRPGVLVQGDVEDVEALGSEFAYLTGQGVELFSHASFEGLLHHKYAIIDADQASAQVITGSHNWTAAAGTVNDENTLVIHDATVANLFYQEWSARHNAVTAVPDADEASSVLAWPVPANAQLHVQVPPGAPAQVTLHDAAGREVYRQEASGLLRIPTAQLPNGVYSLGCQQEGRRAQRLIVVAH